MKTKLIKTCRAIVFCALAIVAGVHPAGAQNTAFTYNGRLTGNGAVASGAYDMQFTLYDAVAAGNIVAGPLTIGSVDVANGLFTVRIDFGAGKFTGPARWLDVAVRPSGGGAFIPLTPRQEVTSSPYSTRSQSAGTADSGGGTNNDSVWAVTASDAHYTNGNVGIGTSTPQAKLHVRGDALRFEKDGKILDLTAGSLTDITARNTSLVLQSLGGSGNNDVILNPFPNSGLFPNGNVGIGTFFPQSKLSVSGNADVSGNVAIGTTTTTNKLEVAGITRVNGQFNVNSSGHDYWVNPTMAVRAGSVDNTPFGVVSSSGAYVFTLTTGYGLPVPSLSMYGDAFKNSGGTSWNTASDRRLKQDIRAYETGLKEILRLRAVRFRYRDDPKRGLTSTHEEVGFIAQKVREVIPDAVTEGQDGYLTLKADPIHWAAINAIQELNTKLEAQRAENTELRQRLEKLERFMNHENGGAK